MSVANDIVVWQPVLTAHQAYTLAALQRLARCNLTVYVLKTEYAERAAQGWTVFDPKSVNFRVETVPDHNYWRWARRLLATNTEAIHIFGSPFENIKSLYALVIAASKRARVYLISEPYSPSADGYLGDGKPLRGKVKARLRPVLYALYGVVLRRRLDGVFAISELSARQYLSMGVEPHKVFPFGYFVPRTPHPRELAHHRQPNAPLRLVFVGSLIVRKGLRELLLAVQQLKNKGFDIVVDVFGAGDPASFDFGKSSARYCGAIPFGETQQVIANYDVSVVPSRHDGWGVVVNEAILAGIPVVCSDRVGASALVAKWRCGIVYESDARLGLQNALVKILTKPEALRKMRERTGIAAATIDPKVAARFMLDQLRGTSHFPLLSSPWYDVQAAVITRKNAHN